MTYINMQDIFENDMNLAILMTNTDVSAFSDKHPKDGEKFTRLIQLVRPKWSCDVFNVTQSQFPNKLAGYDGFMITGSPASVHDKDAWVEQLCRVVQDIHRQSRPVFGACFGHQIIAKALGGHVGPNPKGWELGTVQSSQVKLAPWTRELPKKFPLYAAHIEQVLELPRGAETLAMSEYCPIAAYAIDDTVYTTQYHPEMRPDFIEALVTYLAKDLDEAVISNAQASLAHVVDMSLYAETIAQFFENVNLG